MNKYTPDEYWSVIDTKTGKKIADCGLEKDAKSLVEMRPGERSYVKNTNILTGPVIDVTPPPALPTNEIVVNMDGGVGGSWEEIEQPLMLEEGQLRLQESDAQVFVP